MHRRRIRTPGPAITNFGENSGVLPRASRCVTWSWFRLVYANPPPVHYPQEVPMSSTRPTESEGSESEEWKVPRAPKTFKRSSDPSQRVRLRVFGWAVTIRDKNDWANKLNISRDLSDLNRRDHAYFTMRKRLPAKHVRRTCVRYNSPEFGRTVTNCFYIATNETKEEIKKAKNLDLIYKIWDMILLDDEPRWYLVDEQPL